MPSQGAQEDLRQVAQRHEQAGRHHGIARQQVLAQVGQANDEKAVQRQAFKEGPGVQAVRQFPAARLFYGGVRSRRQSPRRGQAGQGQRRKQEKDGPRPEPQCPLPDLRMPLSRYYYGLAPNAPAEARSFAAWLDAELAMQARGATAVDTGDSECINK